MKFSLLLPVIAFVAAALVGAEAPAAPTELEIVTTFAPEECTVKAKTGDKIKVHYVREHAWALCS